jgi:hypothetical protein
VSPKSQRTYNIRVFGVRNLGYVYAVRASTLKEATEKARHEYRMETGDVVLRVENVKLAPTKNKVLD